LANWIPAYAGTTLHFAEYSILVISQIQGMIGSKKLPVIAVSLTLMALSAKAMPAGSLLFQGESRHLRSVRMLTSGGENAEAYFSPDGKQIVWQGRWQENYPADQIWTMPAEGGTPTLVSTGFGKTTCAFFIPGTNRIVYGSTHGFSKEPPADPDRAAGYVWGLDEYDIYTVNLDGTDLRQLTNEPGYDAESAVSPDGKQIVFTSVRNGDLDIYAMDTDGGNVRQLTTTLGYDGGPFFTPDGKWIVFRSHLPKTDAEIARYKDLLARKMVMPLRFEIQIMRPDGSERRAVTSLGAASWAPYMHPDGKRIIFCSNWADSTWRQEGRMPNFDLYLINLDGTGLERVTYGPEFDGFPMFSNDGKKLIWCSNRFGPHPHSTNIFVSEWGEERKSD